jgi:hypothetical protein
VLSDQVLRPTVHSLVDRSDRQRKHNHRLFAVIRDTLVQHLICAKCLPCLKRHFSGATYHLCDMPTMIDSRVMCLFELRKVCSLIRCKFPLPPYTLGRAMQLFSPLLSADQTAAEVLQNLSHPVPTQTLFSRFSCSNLLAETSSTQPQDEVARHFVSIHTLPDCLLSTTNPTKGRFLSSMPCPGSTTQGIP